MDEALIFAGCANFLDFLKADPDLYNLFMSASTQTIYAVGDKYFNGTMPNSQTPAVNMRRRDLTPADVQRAQLAAGRTETDLARLRAIPGTIISTNDAAANLRGSTQVVVSDYRLVNSKSALHRRGNDSVSTNTSATDALVTLYSGLGDSVNLYNPDIYYQGGVIQVLDGFFTIPATLSETDEILGYTGFANLVDIAGLTDTLDNSSSITVFIPNNAAVQSAQLSASLTMDEIKDIVEDHIIIAASANETVGYLPNLSDGQVLTTKNGRKLTITVDANNNYYVNGVLITTSNIVLTNGVAHVIDDVLVASASSAAGWSVQRGANTGVAVGMAVATILFGLVL